MSRQTAISSRWVQDCFPVAASRFEKYENSHLR
jgi:hypothetical protein